MKTFLKLTLLISLFCENVFADQEKKLFFKNENMQTVGSFDLAKLKSKYKEEIVQVFNFTTQELESYRAFDLAKILDHVYGRNKWRNSYALGTVSTDKYAPIIKNHIFTNLKPYIAYDRADGKPFVSKKNYSKGHITLAPYYIIWKVPKSLGNLKKVRDHWPWKIREIFVFPTEPTEIKTNDKAAIAGKETFINHCIACHSIGRIGGTKGGDLLKMITEKKLNDDHLKKYIINPRSINPKSKMPDFPVFLDDKESRVKRLIYYLRDRVKRFQNSEES